MNHILTSLSIWTILSFFFIKSAGLEKMEKDKMKQLEKEKQKKQREENFEKNKKNDKERMEILKSTMKERQRSKFVSITYQPECFGVKLKL